MAEITDPHEIFSEWTRCARLLSCEKGGAQIQVLSFDLQKLLHIAERLWLRLHSKKLVHRFGAKWKAQLPAFIMSEIRRAQGKRAIISLANREREALQRLVIKRCFVEQPFD